MLWKMGEIGGGVLWEGEVKKVFLVEISLDSGEIYVNSS